MYKATIDKILNQFKSKTEFALELANRDAMILGYGFIVIDSEGNLMYVDHEEVKSLLDQVENETKRNR